MLKTANLSYKFDDKYIFSNLSFEIANDSVFKLVGDNGCLLYTSDAADD